MSSSVAGTFICVVAAVQDVIPRFALLKFILFFILMGLAVFDTYTDWLVVVNFRDNGFSNPLLPHNDIWLTLWLMFVVIGTLLTVVSILHDGITLLYECCCKDDDDDNDDSPLECFYECGCNTTTRNETLSVLTLLFQDLPLLVLSVFFTYVQVGCKSPQPKDVTLLLLNVCISVTVAYAATLCRFIRTIVRMIKFIRKDDITDCTCCVNFYKCFVIIGIILEALALFLSPIGISYVWVDYTYVKSGNLFNDPLKIYHSGHPLFEISGNVIPPNGTFLHIENIHMTEISQNGTFLYNIDKGRDIYCLRTFEYHPEAFQIYFNAVNLFAVSNNADFCAAVNTSVEEMDFSCADLSLYYSSRDSSSGNVRRHQCMFYQQPRFNNTIVNVYRHLGRTESAQNYGEPIALLYQNRFFLLTDVKSSPDGAFQGILDPSVFSNSSDSISCVIELRYLQLPTTGQIQYNYRDVANYGENNCNFSSTNVCSSLQSDLVYGYLSDEYSLVQNTRCSNVTDNQLRLVYQPSIVVRSPC